MPKIPDRWIPYKACGNVIEGTRFICFKVPLKKSVQTGNRDIKEIWDIPALLAKIPKLSGVIDLTNTTRYYNPGELQEAGVSHKKIMMPGRIIPPENKVIEFMNTVDEFLGRDCDSLLGVHCTHGLNRTGYMVVRYMRDRLRIPATDAIKKFEKARGYQIERDNYIADLLGKKVPPPDVGNHTELKPLDRKNSMTYKSPLGYDDEEDSDISGYSDRRYGYNSRSVSNNRNTRNRFNKHQRNSSYSRNDQRDCSGTSKPYDFRYDY